MQLVCFKHYIVRLYCLIYIIDLFHVVYCAYSSNVYRNSRGSTLAIETFNPDLELQVCNETMFENATSVVIYIEES